jgi:hypothetical protein
MLKEKTDREAAEAEKKKKEDEEAATQQQAALTTQVGKAKLSVAQNVLSCDMSDDAFERYIKRCVKRHVV